MRYRLRTLMIVLAIMPPMLWFGYIRWERYRERLRLLEFVKSIDYVGQIDWQAFLNAQAPPPAADDPNSDKN